MPRGVKTSVLEKLQQELSKTQASIKSMEENLEVLKEKENEIKTQIQVEEFNQLKELMNQKGLNIEDIKNMVQNHKIDATEQEEESAGVIISNSTPE